MDQSINPNRCHLGLERDVARDQRDRAIFAERTGETETCTRKECRCKCRQDDSTKCRHARSAKRCCGLFDLDVATRERAEALGAEHEVERSGHGEERHARTVDTTSAVGADLLRQLAEPRRRLVERRVARARAGAGDRLAVKPVLHLLSESLHAPVDLLEQGDAVGRVLALRVGARRAAGLLDLRDPGLDVRVELRETLLDLGREVDAALRGSGRARAAALREAKLDGLDAKPQLLEPRAALTLLGLSRSLRRSLGRRGRRAAVGGRAAVVAERPRNVYVRRR